MVSQRSRFDAEPNRLARALATRVHGRRLLDLTISNPTRAGIPYERDAILHALVSPGALTYEPSAFGLGSAREAVSRVWAERRVEVDPASVALTASTSEAYSLIFKLLCDPGEGVLVPEPSYPLFEHLARYEGVVVEPYRLSYDGAWHVDLDSIQEAVSTRTRAIVTVSPNNPTGSFLKRSELHAIAELGLPIVSDEVFGAYAFGEDPRRARSALEATGALVFALDGLSKFAALPQLKLAWIAVGGPQALVSEALSGLELLCDTYLSPSTPVQHALPALFEHTAASRAAILRRVRTNYAALCRRAAGTAVTPLFVEGGWYAIVRLPSLLTEEAWVVSFLEQSDVLVQPGWYYDMHAEPFVVLSLLTDEAEFDEGVARIIQSVG